MIRLVVLFSLFFVNVCLCEEIKLTEEEKAVLDETNAQRKSAGLPELKISPELLTAARNHASNMAKQNNLQHTLDGQSASDRVSKCGYRFRKTGENIAKGQTTAREVLRSWMGSAGHRANILQGEYLDIGIAMSANSRGERFWVQVFGLSR